MKEIAAILALLFIASGKAGNAANFDNPDAPALPLPNAPVTDQYVALIPDAVQQRQQENPSTTIATIAKAAGVASTVVKAAASLLPVASPALEVTAPALAPVVGGAPLVPAAAEAPSVVSAGSAAGGAALLPLTVGLAALALPFVIASSLGVFDTKDWDPEIFIGFTPSVDIPIIGLKAGQSVAIPRRVYDQMNGLSQPQVDAFIQDYFYKQSVLIDTDAKLKSLDTTTQTKKAIASKSNDANKLFL